MNSPSRSPRRRKTRLIGKGEHGRYPVRRAKKQGRSYRLKPIALTLTLPTLPRDRLRCWIELLGEPLQKAIALVRRHAGGREDDIGEAGIGEREHAARLGRNPKPDFN
jgi:hypothetical protein